MECYRFVEIEVPVTEITIAVCNPSSSSANSPYKVVHALVYIVQDFKLQHEYTSLMRHKSGGLSTSSEVDLMRTRRLLLRKSPWLSVMCCATNIVCTVQDTSPMSKPDS